MKSSTKSNQLHEIKFSSENDLPEPIDRSLMNILKKENFTNSRIDWKRLPFDGNSYLSTLYEIDVSGRTKDEEKEIQLFVKKIVDGASIKVITLPEVYANELFAYKELFKIYDELQEQANIPLQNRYQTIQIYEESNEETIIMEDVIKKGYRTNHSMDALTLNFFEITVKELARFHGLSFVLKETRPEYFTDKIKSIRQPYNFGEDWKEYIEGLKDGGINQVNENFKDKLDKVYEDLTSKYVDYCRDPTLRVCLCHGDFKFTNMMTLVNDSEKQKIIPIDFQFIHYGCPIFDFLYLIFTGTDRDFRKANLFNLKDLYYETLREFLRYFNLNVDTVYPREDFERVYKEKLDFGLMTAIACLPFVLATGKDVPDITQSEWHFPYNEGIKRLFEDVIEEFIEWGYL